MRYAELDGSRKNYFWRLILFTIVLWAFVVHLGMDVVLTPVDPVQLEGKIRSAHFSMNKARKGGGYVAQLVFYVEGQEKRFQLTRRLDEPGTPNELSRAAAALTPNAPVTVWVARQTLDRDSPLVLQVANGRATLLRDWEGANKDRNLFTVMTILALLSTGFIVYTFFPDRINKLLKI